MICYTLACISIFILSKLISYFCRRARFECVFVSCSICSTVLLLNSARTSVRAFYISSHSHRAFVTESHYWTFRESVVLFVPNIRILLEPFTGFCNHYRTIPQCPLPYSYPVQPCARATPPARTLAPIIPPNITFTKLFILPLLNSS